jgi:hypothetical protein
MNYFISVMHVPYGKELIPQRTAFAFNSQPIQYTLPEFEALDIRPDLHDSPNLFPGISVRLDNQTPIDQNKRWVR